VTAQDHHADLVVGLGPQEGVVEFFQQRHVLGISRLGPVQHDPRDAALIEGLIGQELVFRHGHRPFYLDISSRTAFRWRIPSVPTMAPGTSAPGMVMSRIQPSGAVARKIEPEMIEPPQAPM
jgi:hypothetical protein